MWARFSQSDLVVAQPAGLLGAAGDACSMYILHLHANPAVEPLTDVVVETNVEAMI